MTPAAIDDAILRAISLNRTEYARITDLMGRPPSEVELGIFGALWSEHCGYKHSRPHLRTMPTQSEAILVAAGEENAGAVDIGDGLAVVFKIESHNHPSAVEPFQSAATGVGGIIRDIFTMGARPIALFDSLRFGPLDKPRNRYLANGIIGGVGFYGNCVGIPTVGGEVVVDESYEGNPLVNAMCVGLLPHDRLTSATATGTGNPLILVGADTGRDGVHGATFASVEDPEASTRGVVQVGNPFLEKLLIEACLELLETDAVVGMQDLGAAGLTSSAVEAAGRGGAGVKLNIDKVSRRTANLTPYEVMLSESQERMLVVATRGREAEVIALFDRWGLHSDIIGEVTDDGHVTVLDEGNQVARIPIEFLIDAPEYELPVVRPDYLDRVQALDLAQVPESDDLAATLLELLAAPNIASKYCVYRTYDQTVGTNTVSGPGSDAAVLRIKGTKRAIAIATDGNGRHVFLNPRGGGARAVAEAARNVVCTGAEPIAITNCLNFGSPTEPAVYYQFAEAVAGISEACERLGTPVTGGNVSFYNEANNRQIHPTPVIGMLGVLEDINNRSDSAFKDTDDVIALIGPLESDLDGSEYLKLIHGIEAGAPGIDLDLEARVQAACLAGIRSGVVRSAHDVADGGLAVAVAESAIAGGIGATLDIDAADGRRDALLFGESASRIVVSTAPDRLADLERMCGENGASLTIIGRVGGARIALLPGVEVALEEADGAWQYGLADALASQNGRG
ncbi:MAG: phosphoribosylformylglycinamidine synthase subunit PurL [Chloroflexota bacterium]|jgi:phosphoribosylformylglycinamidine synthase|nr:phosphoribosylformylglycinamidine synthase subunit PurL [Chloroflexota bacterium]MDP6758323.1 phosphoribosylformylglycinamidine synthase subunit PurL [Chloroflexota bacterium]